MLFRSLVSVTSDEELNEAMRQAQSILRVYVTKKPEMDEKAPLFHSWVMLNSLVESKSPQIPEEKCKEAIKEVEKISTQVRTCEQLLQTPGDDVESDTPENTQQANNTPTGNEASTKMSIKDIVLGLSKEMAKNLIETSERISKLINNSLSNEPEIVAEINQTAGSIMKILAECSEYSDETLASVRSSSDSTLQSVHDYSDNITVLLASLVKDESIAQLREETIAMCNSLSSSTVSQCLTDRKSVV